MSQSTGISPQRYNRIIEHTKIIFFLLAQVSHENRRDDRQNVGQHAAPAGSQAPLRPRNPDCKETVPRDA
jgi:hypothetical protein